MKPWTGIVVVDLGNDESLEVQIGDDDTAWTREDAERIALDRVRQEFTECRVMEVHQDQPDGD